jgi:hypothetical protein
MSKTYQKQPDLWLGKHFKIDAYLSLIEMDDGTARILIKKPSGQVWAGEIEEIDRIQPAKCPRCYGMGTIWEIPPDGWVQNRPCPVCRQFDPESEGGE